MLTRKKRKEDKTSRLEVNIESFTDRKLSNLYQFKTIFLLKTILLRFIVCVFFFRGRGGGFGFRHFFNVGIVFLCVCVLAEKAGMGHYK